MTDRSKELNKFHSLTCKIRLINADIYFLKQCKFNKVFPKFMKVNVSSNCKMSDKIIFFAKKKWIDSEIKNQYSKRSRLELLAYKLHLKLTKGLNESEYDKWCLFHRKVVEVSEHKFRVKFSKLNSKLQKLIPKNDSHKKSTLKETLVVNESTEVFNSKELELMNKGIKYCLPNGKTPMNEIVVGIETSIKGFAENTKAFIRNACKLQIKQNLQQHEQAGRIREYETIKNLRAKNCFYLKADKGNKIVILDKPEYFNRVENMLAEGPYIKLKKSPLPRMIRESKNALKECPKLITSTLKFRLSVSNPTMPKLYCLPKIHKTGKSMRPIASGINSPTYHLSKWLVNEFKNLPEQPETFAIKNSIEFVQKIKNYKLEEGEILVSFDVTSLFPSVPIPETLTYLAELLNKNKIEPAVVKEYIKLTSTCMSQNCFQIGGNYYEQQQGTAMGNSLSPFLANLFMSNFEITFKKQAKYFPKTWIRYVDDIFAIFDTKKYDLETFLEELNTTRTTIKFTLEKETNGQLAFLDTLIIRNNDKVEIDIFRKKTNVNRFITSDSNHSFPQKMASFHFLINRLMTFPLSKVRYTKELNFIKEIAEYNGFEKVIIDRIIRKKEFKKLVRDTTLLTPLIRKENKFVKLPYHSATKKLNKVFKSQKLGIAYKSNNSLKNLLGNTKDKLEWDKKSGIYEIQCSDCNLRYIGQTRRAISTRYKEHLAHLRFNRPEKSSVARHILETNHIVEPKNFKLVKSVNYWRELDSYESIFIHKNKENLMNVDLGPAPYSSLYELIKN